MASLLILMWSCPEAALLPLAGHAYLSCSQAFLQSKTQQKATLDTQHSRKPAQVDLDETAGLHHRATPVVKDRTDHLLRAQSSANIEARPASSWRRRHFRYLSRPLRRHHRRRAAQGPPGGQRSRAQRGPVARGRAGAVAAAPWGCGSGGAPRLPLRVAPRSGPGGRTPPSPPPTLSAPGGGGGGGGERRGSGRSR